jgi:hypothetical protein
MPGSLHPSLIAVHQRGAPRFCVSLSILNSTGAQVGEKPMADEVLNFENWLKENMP